MPLLAPVINTVFLLYGISRSIKIPKIKFQNPMRKLHHIDT